MPELRALLCAALLALWSGMAGAVELRDIDMAVVLARLGAAASGDDLSAVRAVAPDHAVALAGTATWREVAATLAARSDGALGPEGLRRPLLVQTGAELTVAPGETLSLEASAGAFVLNLGLLRVAGGTVRAAAPGPREATFRPFLVSAGAGSLLAEGARFERLGFGTSLATAGVSVLSGGVFASAARVELSRSVFSDLGGVALRGVLRPDLRDLRIEASRGSALVLRGVAGGRISGLSVSGTGAGDGVRLAEGTRGVTLEDVDIRGTAAAGLRIADAARHVRLTRVRIEGAGGDGVTLDEAACIDASDLSVSGAGAKGIAIRRASLRLVRGAVAEARGAGMDASEGARVRIAGARVEASRIGIRSRDSAFAASGVDLSRQFPRLLEGDVDAEALLAVARSPAGAIPWALGPTPERDWASLCTAATGG